MEQKKILSALSVNITGHLVDIGIPRTQKGLTAEHFNSGKEVVEVEGAQITLTKEKIVSGLSDGGFVLV